MDFANGLIPVIIDQQLMPARRKKTVRLRSAKPKKRWWKLFLVLSLCLVGIWITLTVVVNLLLSWTGDVAQSRVIAFTNSPSTDIKKSILIVLLDSNQLDSKLALVELTEQDLELNDPWQVASVAGVLVNQVIPLGNVNLSNNRLAKQAIQKNILQQLREKQLRQAWQLLPIWKLLQTKNLVLVDQVEEASLELAVLGSMGEACPIGVANTTNTAGIATKYADLVTKQGGLVVRVTNRELATEATTIFIDELLTAECQSVADLLSQSLPGLVNTEVTSGVYSRDRVGILVQLGESTVEQLQTSLL